MAFRTWLERNAFQHARPLAFFTLFSQMQASLNHFRGVRARPSRACIPDYVVQVSTVGGLVIGPLVAALFLAAWSLLDERRESGWTS